ncbi:rRNA maturation RNase YbeY [Mycoplasma phocoenae]|uniref:Endoribonuclease YbeY n=1 Tax=Mycoplasma phocoenae TaxID=754517 RepID=A0A858U6D6_9MOLU|nr:rRNA maturation RNase YbeY [Mycoplasma phocoenae]QJG66793.1 rRNA maturation RNase YbeY [Mycoplasma phocoenae]
MNKLLFTNETNYQFRYLKEFKQILDFAQKEFKSKKNIEVDLVLMDNESIHQYNLEYRNKDKPTDILSFPIEYEGVVTLLDTRPLGQLLISYEKIKEQAKTYGHTIKREYCYIFCHGIAHLFGFDHLTPEEEKIMNSHVDNIMKKMNIGR